MLAHPYPVEYAISPPEHYNRWTVFFRWILAIPQIILVGAGLGGSGILKSVLSVLTFFAWIVILFTGRYPQGMRDFNLMIFRWAQNVQAYIHLQAEPYPPFGRGDYPLQLRVEPADHYNRWGVAFRVILAIPQIIAVAVLSIAQGIVTLIAWFAILFTGHYPEGLFGFSLGVSRWSSRVEAYLYLFVDEYPPFSLAAEPDAGTPAPQPA